MLAVAAGAHLKPSPPLRVVIDGRSIARRFPHGPSISFRYPANWHVTRHRLDNVLDPRTLFAVATYRLPRGPIDNCDGTHARGRPADGAFVLVKEVLDGASLRRSLPRLPVRPSHFRLPTHGAAGCLPAPSVRTSSGSPSAPSTSGSARDPERGADARGADPLLDQCGSPATRRASGGDYAAYVLRVVRRLRGDRRPTRRSVSCGETCGRARGCAHRASRVAA